MPKLAPIFTTWLRHTWILLLEEIRDLLLRPRALISIALYLASLSLAAYGLIHFDTAVGDVLQKHDNSGRALREILQRLHLQDYTIVLDHIEEWPLLFPLFQFYMIFWLPTFVALVSCDMINTDRSRGTLRFLFLKTTRWRYYCSKFLAHFLLYFVLHAVSLALLAGGLLMTSEQVVSVELVKPFLLCLLMFVPYAVFVVSVTEFVSALTRGTLSSLLLVHLFWFLVLLLMIFWGDFPLRFSHFVGIIFPFGDFLWVSILHTMGWALAFMALGYALFRRSEI